MFSPVTCSIWTMIDLEIFSVWSSSSSRVSERKGKVSWIRTANLSFNLSIRPYKNFKTATLTLQSSAFSLLKI